MIERPEGFASVRTDHPVQGELRELLSQLHLASRVDATWSEYFHPKFSLQWFSIMRQNVDHILSYGLPDDLRRAFGTRTGGTRTGYGEDLVAFGRRCDDVAHTADVIGTAALVTEMMRLWTPLEPQLQVYKTIVDKDVPGNKWDERTDAGKNRIVLKSVVHILTEMAKFVEHYKDGKNTLTEWYVRKFLVPPNFKNSVK
jgi:hypothetical protein